MENTTHIDFVIAYVNNNDIVWRKNYINYCKSHNLNNKIVDLMGARYGGIDFINYQLKLVQKNMPWINKIYLLLSNVEQKPKNLPSNCVVVYHNQFIPQQFLPTFNSTTIEMFLWNIPNLSEYFIYANDDMLPTGKLEPSDFFENGKVKLAWKNQEFYFSSTMFAYQCRNNVMALSKRLNLGLNDMEIIKPVHSFTPMILSHCKESYNLLKDLIVPHIRAFRTEYQYNQYIYPLYEHFKYGSLESTIDFYYTELDNEFDFNHQIICVNGEREQKYIDKFLKDIKVLCE